MLCIEITGYYFSVYAILCVFSFLNTCYGPVLKVLYMSAQMDSRLHTDNLSKVLEVATEGCKRVHTIMDTVVKSNLKTVSLHL